MKHILIFKENPKHHQFLEAVQSYLNELDHLIYFSRSILESRKIISELKESCRIYICGGDGTIHALLPVLIHTQHEIVPIPLGTGNDFVRMTYTSKNPKDILIQSLHLKATRIDLIQINDQYCFNSSCFGIDSLVASHVHDKISIPCIPESKSYIFSILHELTRFHGNLITVISEGKKIYSKKVILCTFNNGIYYGGGFPVTQKADLQDGLFDFQAVEDIPYYKIPVFLPKLFSDQLGKQKECYFTQLKEVTVYSQNISCNIDGEEYSSDEYHFRIIPACISFVIEKSSKV